MGAGNVSVKASPRADDSVSELAMPPKTLMFPSYFFGSSRFALPSAAHEPPQYLSQDMWMVRHTVSGFMSACEVTEAA